MFSIRLLYVKYSVSTAMLGENNSKCAFTLFFRFIETLEMLMNYSRSDSLKGILKTLNQESRHINQLHIELMENLRSAMDSYLSACTHGLTLNLRKQARIGDVFLAMKDKLLIYAPFIVHCQSADKKIRELENIDLGVKEDIERLQVLLKCEMDRTQNPSLPPSFNSLVNFPMQHVLR